MKRDTIIPIIDNIISDHLSNPHNHQLNEKELALKTANLIEDLLKFHRMTWQEKVEVEKDVDPGNWHGGVPMGLTKNDQ